MAIESLPAPRGQSSGLPINAIVLRAAVVAAVLGSVLTLINQGLAVFGPAPVERLPLALVYLTPFVVVAISQILGMRQAQSDARAPGTTHTKPEPFMATVAGHGIPFRAALTGLIAGSVNTSIVLLAGIFGGEEPDALPLGTLAQAFALPMLFGALSQALSYRRAFAERSG